MGKKLHEQEGVNKAAAELERLRNKSAAGVNKDEACNDYQADVAAAEFGTCKCGHPKEAHIAKAENKAATELERLKRKSTTGARTAEPCNDYKADVNAATFGTCLCGHPKEAHGEKEMNHAESALIAMKEKNAQKRAAEEAEAARIEAEKNAAAEAEQARIEAEKQAKAGQKAPLMEKPGSKKTTACFGFCAVQ